MFSRVRGDALYSTLSDLKCPDLAKFTPEALDWLYEDAESRRLLEWMTANVSSQNYLSDEELEAYSQIPKNELLSGEVLDAALEAAADEDSSLSTEDLERKISKLETELGWYEESVDTISLVKRSLVEKNASESVELDRLRLEAEKEAREERRVQEHVLELNSQFNAALLSLRTCLEALVGEFTKVPGHVEEGSENDPRVHLVHLHLDKLQQKEEELDNEIGKLLNSHFGSKFSELGIGGDIEVENNANSGLIDLRSESVLELVRGRDMAEFLHLRSEINRVRVSIYRTEIERIETIAKAEGTAAALVYLQRQAQIPGALVRPLIDHPSSEPVNRPHPLITEPNNKLNNQISSLVAQCVSCYCQKILTTDYKTKYGRSMYIINKLKLIRDDLLQRRARQEILDFLFVTGTDQMLDLVDTMENIVEDLDGRYRKRLGYRTAVQGLGCSKKAESLILPQDQTFSNLHSILRISGCVDSLATYSGVESALKDLLSERKSLQEKHSRKQSTRLRNLHETEAGIRRLTASLNLSVDAPLRGLSLVPKQVSRGISSLDRGIKELELKLKNLLTDWERQKSELKNKAYHRQQRDLWIEFVLRPQILSANVKAVQNKAKD